MEMAHIRKYPCPRCGGDGQIAAWDAGCEFSPDPACHYDVECPDCTFGAIECDFSDLEVADLCLCPAFIEECPLSDADFIAASSAMRSGDLEALGCVFLDAIVREATQRVSDAANAEPTSVSNAAYKLLREYSGAEVASA